MTGHGLEVFDPAHVTARTDRGAAGRAPAPGEAGQLLDLLTRFTYPAGD